MTKTEVEDDMPTVAIVMSRGRDPEVLPLANIPASFAARGESFVTVPCTDWLGFYDWLRSDTEEVIGLRLFLDHTADLDLSALRNLNGVEIEERAGRKIRELTIFLTSSREFNESKSDDGAFGFNHLFRGDRGSIAITFRAP